MSTSFADSFGRLRATTRPVILPAANPDGGEEGLDELRDYLSALKGARISSSGSRKQLNDEIVLDDRSDEGLGVSLDFHQRMFTPSGLWDFTSILVGPGIGARYAVDVSPEDTGDEEMEPVFPIEVDTLDEVGALMSEMLLRYEVALADGTK